MMRSRKGVKTSTLCNFLFNHRLAVDAVAVGLLVLHLLLLRNGLLRDNLREALEAGSLEPWICISIKYIVWFKFFMCLNYLITVRYLLMISYFIYYIMAMLI